MRYKMIQHIAAAVLFWALMGALVAISLVLRDCLMN